MGSIIGGFKYLVLLWRVWPTCEQETACVCFWSRGAHVWGDSCDVETFSFWDCAFYEGSRTWYSTEGTTLFCVLNSVIFHETKTHNSTVGKCKVSPRPGASPAGTRVRTWARAVVGSVPPRFLFSRPWSFLFLERFFRGWFFDFGHRVCFNRLYNCVTRKI